MSDSENEDSGVDEEEEEEEEAVSLAAKRKKIPVPLKRSGTASDEEDDLVEEEGEEEREDTSIGEAPSEMDTDENEDEEEDSDDDGSDSDLDVPSAPKQGGLGSLSEGIETFSDDGSDGSKSDDDDDGENYLQKFDAEVNTNYILQFHPECVKRNYVEVLALCVVQRDSSNCIVDALHRTIPFLTKYEKTRILGVRAKQLNSGAPSAVTFHKDIIDGNIMAAMELAQRKIPFIISRPIPGGKTEYWRVTDLEDISF